MSFGQIQMAVENKNDGENENDGTDELWVENEIGFGWIGLRW